MKVTVGAASDVGRARERNEDSYLAMPPVYIVADGMGGHRGGNVASSLAMQVMSGLADGGGSQMLAEQVRQANHAILERSRADRDLQGMGTTITATYFENGTVHLAQVGDSRAYLLRGGQLSQVTTDHTLVHEMVIRQQITPEEAEHHPQRSILTRALGVDEGVEVDEFDIEAQAGDRLLLCSDGLHSMVGDQVIHQVLQDEPSPQAAADRLVALANEAGGLDNITVVIMEFAQGQGFEGATWVPPAPPETATTRETPIPGGLDVTAQYQTAPPAAAAPAPGAAPAAATGPPPPMPHTAEPDDAPPFPGTAARPAPPVPGRHRDGPGGRRKLVWIVGLVALLAVALVGTRLYLNTKFFVGVDNGKVAVFRGIPHKTLGYRMFSVVESSNIDGRAAFACPKWHDAMLNGETVGSQTDGDQVLAKIAKDLAPGGDCSTVTGTNGTGNGGSGGTTGGSPSSSPT
jgi:PPM family protein phosphatase